MLDTDNGYVSRRRQSVMPHQQIHDKVHHFRFHEH